MIHFGILPYIKDNLGPKFLLGQTKLHSKNIWTDFGGSILIQNKRVYKVIRTNQRYYTGSKLSTKDFVHKEIDLSKLYNQIIQICHKESLGIIDDFDSLKETFEQKNYIRHSIVITNDDIDLHDENVFAGDRYELFLIPLLHKNNRINEFNSRKKFFKYSDSKDDSSTINSLKWMNLQELNNICLHKRHKLRIKSLFREAFLGLSTSQSLRNLGEGP